MKKIIPILAIFSIISTSLTITPTPIVNAGSFLDLNNQEGFQDGKIATAYGESGTPIDIRTFTANIIKGVLGLLGIIFLVLLIVAGYKYMMSQGNEDQVTESKKQITHAVIGLIIILSAYGLTVFILELAIKGGDNSWIF